MQKIKIKIKKICSLCNNWLDRDTIDVESVRRTVPGIVQEVIYLTAGLNSCLNPLLYGAYYYSKNGEVII